MVDKEPGPRSGGLTVSKNIPKLGYKGIETVEMSYVDHRVPTGALLGDPGRGLGYILGARSAANIAARAVGVARAGSTPRMSRSSSPTFGKPIAQRKRSR